MKKIFRFLIAAGLLVPFASAQLLSVTISPNPAPLGAPITITAQAAAPNLYTPFGCLLSGVHSGTPAGPTVTVFGCTLLGVAIPVCGSPTFRTQTWNQAFTGGGFATPGQYWFEIRHSVGQFGVTTPEFFCVTIDDPNNATPVLSAVNAPLFGTPFQMSLLADNVHAFQPYLLALSFTTNTGIPIPGGHVCLDPDWLFAATLAGDPFLFVNFTAALDFSGAAPPIVLNIPYLAGVPCVPIHAQAAVVTSLGTILLSNALPISIH